MGIKSAKVMVGHIAGDPRLSYGKESGTPRFYARVGVDHWQRESDGTFTKQDRTFHDLVVKFDLAEVAMQKFSKGDDFIATGDFRKFTDTQGVEREEFAATTISHNPTKTDYLVNRERRSGIEQETAGVERNQAFERPDQAAPAHEAATLGR